MYNLLNMGADSNQDVGVNAVISEARVTDSGLFLATEERFRKSVGSHGVN